MSDITSINSVIVFSSKALAAPIIFEEFWTNDMISFDEAENVKTEIGADGKIYTAMTNVVHSGTIKFSASSPSLAEIRTIQKSQKAVKRVIIGTLTVVIPNLGQTYTLNDFHFVGASIPPTLAETVKEVPVKWKSQLPDSEDTPNIANKSITDLKSALDKLSSVKDIANKINNLF